MATSGTTSKWTAFLLSACMPGVGQLAAGSWTSIGWFAAAGLFVAGLAQIQPLVGDAALWLRPLQVGGGIALCLLSAEHAKRLLELRPASGGSAVIAESVCQSSCRGRILDIAISLDVARSPGDLWRLIADLPRFLVIDPFHEEVTLMRDQAAPGVHLVLAHNAFGIRFLRFGRIIVWQEGSGYTFSDLSSRGPRSGFPHVFTVTVEPLSGLAQGRPLTRLTVRIRGRWTSRLTPLWLGRLWIWLVCREHARLLHKAL